MKHYHMINDKTNLTKYDGEKPRCKQMYINIKIYSPAHSLSIPSSSMSTGSGLAGLVSGLGSISPGLSLRGSSTTSPSFCWAFVLVTDQRGRRGDANTYGEQQQYFRFIFEKGGIAYI